MNKKDRIKIGAGCMRLELSIRGAKPGYAHDLINEMEELLRKYPDAASYPAKPLIKFED